jgi:glycosyltransferase involved in cell wall biosynthesis
MDTPPRLLIISHDVVGSRMAGPGIRAWETARVLAGRQPVTLVAPQPIDLPAQQCKLGSYTWGDAASLAVWLRQSDVVLANGFVLRAHPELAQAPQPLALDLYDPVILEGLEASRAMAPEQRDVQHALLRDLLRRQLAAGDFLVCATERQRDLYIGALLAGGRVTPQLAEADPTLRGLIDVAPFGLPPDPPERSGPGIRGVLPGIGPDELVLLWTGGLWDWLDPPTLVEAMALVAEREPRARLVFLAGRHPGQVAEMRAPELARDRAQALNLLGRSVLFYEQWLPYEQRANFLLDADLAVSLHRAHLETAYAAVRSRFLDHLWAGLASIVSAGDAAADLVDRYGLGRVVPVGDAAAVAQAVVELLGDAAERRRCGARARELGQQLTWERTLEPLARFCLSPRHTRAGSVLPVSPALSQAQPAPPSIEELMADYTRLRELVARLHERWRVEPRALQSALPLVGQLKRMANRLTEWYVRPIVAQQNAFNADLVNSIQVLADTLERLASEHGPMQQHLADIEQHLLDIDDAQTALARRLAAGHDDPAS